MKAIGLILAGGKNYRMQDLSKKRAIGAMPIAGSYRSIDFTLSNMSNSHINKVAVLTQYNAKSLNEHLNSSKWWDFGRKQGGLSILAPVVNADRSSWYRGTIDAMYQNIDFLKKSHEPYVVIAPADCVYKLNFNKVIAYHVEKNADITVVCHEMEPGIDVERYGILAMDADDRIVEFEEKPLQAKTNLVSCGIYVVRRRSLIDMIETSAQEERYDFVRDVLMRYKDVKKFYGYNMQEYWRNIASVEDYFGTNMDFLKPEVRDYFFRQYPDIYSKVDDLPPAKYNYGASVRNSLVSSGCIVNGVVENSVMFKKSYIGSHCVIKNSIILNDVYIGDDCYIENCIVESHGTIKAGSRYVGEDGNIRIVVERNDRYDM